MIYVQAHRFQKIPQLPDSIQEMIESYVRQIPDLFDEEISSLKKGIYLATSDAGAHTSVLFWKEALKHKPKFANPIHFPWTLANAPAGYFARFFKTHGPNYTLVGCADALIAAFDHAYQDLSADRVEQALVVALDFKDIPESGLFLLSRKVAKSLLRYASEAHCNQIEGLSCDLAKVLCQTIDQNMNINFGFPGDVVFELMNV